MHWLRYFVISLTYNPMAYKRNRRHETIGLLLIVAVAVIVLLVVGH